MATSAPPGSTTVSGPSRRRARRPSPSRRARVGRAPRRAPRGGRARTTAARSSALPDGIVDPAFEVIGGRSAPDCRRRWTMNSRFPFGPGRPESTTPTTCGPPSAAPTTRGGADVAKHPPAHLRVTDDALRHVRPAGLELRLDQHERLPAGGREPQQRRQHDLDGDERDVADDQGRRERQLRDDRALTRSSTVTRSSARSRGWSWP